MKPTVSHIERLLADVERRPLRLPVRAFYDPGERSKEEALAKLAADRPERYGNLTVKDLRWVDEVPALQAKTIAEHVAAHPEDANCDFRCFVRVIVVFHEDAALKEATAVAAPETSEPSETLGILSTSTPEPTDVAVEMPPAPVVSMRDSPWRGPVRKSGWLAL